MHYFQDSVLTECLNVTTLLMRNFPLKKTSVPWKAPHKYLSEKYWFYVKYFQEKKECKEYGFISSGSL